MDDKIYGIEDKILGGLYGVFVGDALGVTYEFMSAKNIPDIDLKIRGGGYFNLSVGQVSDDSEMTILVLNAIASIINLDVNDFLKKYQPTIINKYRWWYNTNPPDIGNTIRRSISSKDMVETAKTKNFGSISNGVLMRIYPIAVYGTCKNLNDKDLHKLVRLECDVTHPNDLVVDVAYLYCIIVKMILNNYSIQYIKDNICNYTTNEVIKSLIKDANLYPEPITLNGKKIMTDDAKFMGYMGIALQNTLYELFNGYSFDASIQNIIKRGGDTDTNGAIAGGILGAYYGKANIKKKWIKSVVGAKYSRIIDFPSLSVKASDKFMSHVIRVTPVKNTV